MMLMRKAKSWFTGYNSNVPGHEQGTIRYLVYNGGSPKYVDIINSVAAKGYPDVMLSADRAPAEPAASRRHDGHSYARMSERDPSSFAQGRRS